MEAEYKRILIDQIVQYHENLQHTVNEYDFNHMIFEICDILEAIFYHGQKKSLFGKTLNVLNTLGVDFSYQNLSNFWPTILLISHRDVIERIRGFKQLNTETGYCRAWIRLTLNERLMSAYLTNIRCERNLLNSFYNRCAFLRDADSLEIVEKFFSKFESMEMVINLPLNSSLLNSCNLKSLKLAGICSWDFELVTSDALTSGFDVASSLEDIPTAVSADEDVCVAEEPIEVQRPPSPDLDEVADDLSRLCQQLDDLVEGKEQIEIKSDEEPKEVKYNQLYEMHLQEANEVNLNLIWNKFESVLTQQDETISQIDVDIEDPNFVSPAQILTHQDLKNLVKQTCKLAPEISLSQQRFQCAACSSSFGLSCTNGVTTKLCYFTGYHFCDNCIDEKTYVIPAKVMYNLDFAKYSVSKKTAIFFENFQNHKFIDIEGINPHFFKKSKEFANIHRMLMSLTYMKLYLSTCSDDSKDEILPLFHNIQIDDTSKRVMLSILDLSKIAERKKIDGSSRTISLWHEELKSISEVGNKHILSCQLCSQRGFFCEICKKSDIIYPFQVMETYNCDICRACYHIDCYLLDKKCVKCIRKALQ